MPALQEPPAPPARTPDFADETLRGLDEAFGITTPTPEPPAPAPAPEPAPQPAPPEEPAPAPEPTVDDLDAPPAGAKKVEKVDNKNLRTQLEEKNKLAKEAAAEAAALKAEKEAWATEREALRAELDAKSTVVERDPVPPEQIDFNAQPTVKRHIDTIQQKLESTADIIGGQEGGVLTSNFNSYLKDFLLAGRLTGAAKQEALQALNDKLESDLGENNRRDAIKLLHESAPEYFSYVQEVERLKSDAHNLRTRATLEKYTSAERELMSVLNPLGSLPPEIIAAKPHSPESYVANLISTDPVWASRSNRVKQEVAKAFLGVKPLSPEEQSAYESNNMGGLTGAQEKRVQDYKKAQAEGAKHLYLGRMLYPNLPTILERLAELEERYAAESSEEDALSHTPPAPKPKEEDKSVIPDMGQSIDNIYREV